MLGLALGIAALSAQLADFILLSPSYYIIIAPNLQVESLVVKTFLKSLNSATRTLSFRFSRLITRLAKPAVVWVYEREN